MTVALGAKGNNFVLGGKVAQVSAEEAYSVRVHLHVILTYTHTGYSKASHDSGLWKGCRIRRA